MHLAGFCGYPLAAATPILKGSRQGSDQSPPGSAVLAVVALVAAVVALVLAVVDLVVAVVALVAAVVAFVLAVVALVTAVVAAVLIVHKACVRLSSLGTFVQHHKQHIADRRMEENTVKLTQNRRRNKRGQCCECRLPGNIQS